MSNKIDWKAEAAEVRANFSGMGDDVGQAIKFMGEVLYMPIDAVVNSRFVDDVKRVANGGSLHRPNDYVHETTTKEYNAYKKEIERQNKLNKDDEDFVEIIPLKRKEYDARFVGRYPATHNGGRVWVKSDHSSWCSEAVLLANP